MAPTTTTLRGSDGPRGFSLLEVVIVIVVIAILAATSLPALGRLDEARAHAAGDAVELEGVFARAHAMATGLATGLAVDPAAQAVSTVVLDPVAGVTDAAGPTGVARGSIDIPGAYRGASLASFTGPDGAGGAGVVWFGHDGAPEIRDDDGVLVGPATHDAVVVMGNGARVSVQSASGAIVLVRAGGGTP